MKNNIFYASNKLTKNQYISENNGFSQKLAVANLARHLKSIGRHTADKIGGVRWWRGRGLRLRDRKNECAVPWTGSTSAWAVRTLPPSRRLDARDRGSAGNIPYIDRVMFRN